MSCFCDKNETFFDQTDQDLYIMKTQEGYFKTCNDCTQSTNENVIQATQTRLFANADVTLDESIRITLNDIYFEAEAPQETNFEINNFEVLDSSVFTPLYGESKSLKALNETASISVTPIASLNSTLKFS